MSTGVSTAVYNETGNGAGLAEAGEDKPLLNSPDGAVATPEKALSVVSLVSIIFFLVCGPQKKKRGRDLRITSITSMLTILAPGGSYGTEDLGGAIAPLWALLGIILVPWLFSLPIALMTAEMATAMPTQGGFITWIQSPCLAKLVLDTVAHVTP